MTPIVVVSYFWYTGTGNIEFKENGGWEWLHVVLSQFTGIEFDEKKSPSSPEVGGRIN